MNKKLLSKHTKLSRIKFLLISLLILTCLSSKAQSVKEITDAKLVLVQSVPMGYWTPPYTKIDKDALYSNITTLEYPMPNEGATDRSGNIITNMVADSLGFAGGKAPYGIKQVFFTCTNLNPVDVTIRVLLRFYEADRGDSAWPGTYIAGYTFEPVTIPAYNINLYSVNTDPSVLKTKKSAIYAGLIYDNNHGATGATIDQMNQLGQGKFQPIDVGTSTDNIFVTDSAGLYDSSDPVGRVYGFMPVEINPGWQLISATPLPIILKDFQATKQGSTNQLKWTTSQESNGNHFIIERSADGNNFNEIGEVNAAGNSSLPLKYQFTDENPLNGINYYRLRLIDKDNSQKVSDIVSVRNSFVSRMTIYPNPAKNLITIELSAEKIENAQIDITDLNGAKVLRSHATLTSGTNKVTFNIGSLPAGIYNVNVKTTSGSQTIKISKL